MVSDKFQARSTGAVVPVTRQPVKGRKKGGGIRLGEMERDALLAHGVSFCVHDRLVLTCGYCVYMAVKLWDCLRWYIILEVYIFNYTTITKEL